MESLPTRPPVSVETVRTSLQLLYGIDWNELISVKELNGYDDRNFRIEVKSDPKGYVLKIMNAIDSIRTDIVEGQHALIEHLNSKGFLVPLPVKNKTGKYYKVEEFGNPESKHVVRLLKYVIGVPMAGASPSDSLFENVGKFTARVTLALQDFNHSALANRSFLWSLAESSKILSHVDSVVDAPERRDLVKEQLKMFEDRVLSTIGSLQKGIIHGDINTHNLLVAQPSSTVVEALIDFGDAHEAPLLFEAAVALAYSMIHASSISPARPFLNGYESVRRLTELEKSLIKTCVCARICQSLVLGLVSAKNNPENEYVLDTQKCGWNLLEELSSVQEFS